MKISAYLNEWHESRKAILRTSTYEAEGIYIRCHLIPYFESNSPELEELKAKAVYDYMTYKLQNGRGDSKLGGLSKVSVAKHLSILRKALDQAVIFGLIGQNPAESVHPPRSKTVSARTVFLEPEEIQRLFE